MSSDLWGEPVADRVHVVARSRWGHEGFRVAGEGVAIGREAVGGATVGREPALVHRGGRERLRTMQRAAAVYDTNRYRIRTRRNSDGNEELHHDLFLPWERVVLG